MGDSGGQMEGSSSIDAELSLSEFLTSQQVIDRRSRRLKQLAKIYRTHYWVLMEHLKTKYRHYYWKYGRSPFKQDIPHSEKNPSFSPGGDYNNNNEKLGFEDDNGIRKCAVGACKAAPMPLTKFCHPHILLDSNQILYKACTFVFKSSQPRQVLCGKPVLRSTVPALCPRHFQQAEMYMARALRKAGLNLSSPSKVAPKFHVIVREFVCQIQTKRRLHRQKMPWKFR